MLDRLINIFYFFSIVFIFLVVADAAEHTRIIIALFLSFFGAYLAFLLNWLTIDGTASAILFGIIAFGLGGLTAAFTVLVFFITSSLVSKDLISEEGFLEKKFRRDGIQVWSNGFWFAFWLIIWFLIGNQIFMIASVASIAFATGDTWGSEIGGRRIKGTTWLITSFNRVKPGTDGGVSVMGTFFTLAGAVLIALTYWLLNLSTPTAAILIIAIAGFSGSCIDSVFGATIQGKRVNKFFRNIFARQIFYVDNNMVNWLSAGSSAAIALIASLALNLN